MHTVAVTGVSGNVGQRVLRLLDADPTVDRVVGIDARDPRFRPHKLSFRRLDLASADLVPVVAGADAVVHLAWVFGPPRDEELLARVNLAGTRRLLEAATTAGVKSFVFVSSAMVYGAWPDNPVPLTEAAPLRPNPAFAYAAQKVEVERLLADWAGAHPDAAVTVLRPAPALDPDNDHWLARAWRGAGAVRVRRPPPPMQCVHEDDLASAVALGLRKRLAGAFNVAPDGWVPGEQVRPLVSPGLGVALPERLARRVMRLGWATGLLDTTPAVVPYLVHPWVVANDRLEAEGWRPVHSNEEALVAARPLPAWRALLARRRQEVALAAGGGVLAGLAGAVVAVVRRRRALR